METMSTRSPIVAIHLTEVVQGKSGRIPVILARYCRVRRRLLAASPSGSAQIRFVVVYDDDDDGGFNINPVVFLNEFRLLSCISCLHYILY